METKSKDTFDKYKAMITKIMNEFLTPEEPYPHGSDFIHKKLIEDLGADSIDHVELVMSIEEEIGQGIPDDEAEAAETVLDLILLAMKHDDVEPSEIDRIKAELTPPEKTVRRSLKQPRDPSKTDWSKADAKSDADIAADVASDPDAAPLLQKGEDLGQIVRPHLKTASKRMDQATMDQITDEATHAALTVLRSSGIYVNSMQTDALNDSITAIVQGDNENRRKD